MKIKTLETAGVAPALIAMRNPMNSWDKSDSKVKTNTTPYFIDLYNVTCDFQIGEKDKELSIRLQKAGPEHCKHLRMIQVWADISAPRYWLIELDTYRAGVEKVSCSTMHKLMARKVTMDDFEIDDKNSVGSQVIVQYINDMMDEYRDTDDPEEKKAIWRHIIQHLPQSYIQKRTYMFSYAALRNIYHQREGHRLKEWQQFREWVESLPESWMITE